MKKIVVASDSFKGSVSSPEVAQYVEKAIRKIYPECEVVKVSVADGGEGTVKTLTTAMNGYIVSCTAHNPLMLPIQAEYGISGNGKTAIIEIASVSGLTLIPPEQHNPMLTTTYGTGELIRDALEKGCDNFLIGIGGSATNDAGTGMLQALGFRFLDKEGKELGIGGEILEHINSVDRSGEIEGLCKATFTIACDVNNPFSGINGAAYVYARQKGADDNMIRLLDNGLKHFAEVIRKTEQKEIDTIAGAGAAGGLGGAFPAFLNATLKPGIQMVLDALCFDQLIRDADLIITGEGKLDRQTGMGKAPAGILNAARKAGIPVIAIGGSIEETEMLNEQGFLATFSIQPFPVTLQKAMEKEFTGQNITRTVEQLLRVIQYYAL